MRLFQDLCSDLGMSLSLEKAEGPTHHLTFWSLGINTVSMTM